jgi:hypothetical protein
MADLYGRRLSRRDIARHAGMLSQFAGVRLVTLDDGVERGIRMLEFRTGTGFRFTVLVDRALDVADCEFRGAAIGWHSPSGFRHPGLHEYEGEGGLAWLRSFSGLFVTCGLDHILFMHADSAGHYHYVHRKSVDSSIHGRISTIPARLTGTARGGMVTSARSTAKAWCSNRPYSAKTFTWCAGSKRRWARTPSC